MTRRVRMIIQYDGTAYAGWQRQLTGLGIQQVMEEELRGQNGLRTVVQDQDGSVVRVEETVKAVPGHTVQLTLNQTVQAAAQKGLADRISYLNKNAPATRGKEAEAGAVVAIDVKTGGVIAMASYPDYSLNDYYTGYSEMVQQTPSPLLNRATQGLYTVGSTYKPAVSLAALDTGTVTTADRVNCTGRYTYYRDYQPVCEGVHGPINVIDALRVSCNIFFYDMGRRIGIETINEYSYSLGMDTPPALRSPSWRDSFPPRRPVPPSARNGMTATTCNRPSASWITSSPFYRWQAIPPPWPAAASGCRCIWWIKYGTTICRMCCTRRSPSWWRP